MSQESVNSSKAVTHIGYKSCICGSQKLSRYKSDFIKLYFIIKERTYCL